MSRLTQLIEDMKCDFNRCYYLLAVKEPNFEPLDGPVISSLFEAVAMAILRAPRE